MDTLSKAKSLRFPNRNTLKMYTTITILRFGEAIGRMVNGVTNVATPMSETLIAQAQQVWQFQTVKKEKGLQINNSNLQRCCSQLQYQQLY
mmetsp:Transcript_24405/g.33905  ORF Transcript_24405/g.33905 Transcript_24405/m.33905 type:complete len:91 (+) Transcript_24405:1276-1548(+)